ncbi:MAG: hypothetical protein HC871_14270 [Rhizobiales bacterium]|nr:hypothetical protein [Hyphomicrobiales bacterium]
MALAVAVVDQLLHALDAVGGLQPLLGEDVLEMAMIGCGEAFGLAFPDGDAGLDALADGAPARALHAGEDRVLAQGEIGHVAADDAVRVAELAPFLDRHVAIGDLEMQAAELLEGEALEGRKGGGAGTSGRRLKPI